MKSIKKRNSNYYKNALKSILTIDDWTDAFIYGDVYILGFGFGFSEMDLWWLLNRKKRENQSKGKTFYYNICSESMDEKAKLSNNTKLTLLKLMDVKIENIEVKDDN
ncbi:MAG: hypothetical protein K2J79_10280 [Ruminiclostridium sp.]|nr:hypothetical protein [Ruminiclostridium sp.]